MGSSLHILELHLSFVRLPSPMPLQQPSRAPQFCEGTRLVPPWLLTTLGCRQVARYFCGVR